MIQICLADPSGCDDVSNDYGCLGTPNDVLDSIASWVETVYKYSTSAYAAATKKLAFLKAIAGVSMA